MTLPAGTNEILDTEISRNEGMDVGFDSMDERGYNFKTIKMNLRKKQQLAGRALTAHGNRFKDKQRHERN